MLKEYLSDKMEYLYFNKDYESLIETCDELLEMDGDNPVALNYKAIALYYLERYDKSMELLEYNLNLHPTNPYVLNNKALVYIALGEYQNALDCCEEGLKYKDFDWLQINKVESLIYLGREDEAMEFFQSIHIPFYTFENALENCGKMPKDETFERIGKLFDECQYGEVLKLCDEQESSELLLEFRILSLFYLKRDDEAMDFLSRAIEEYPYNHVFCFIKAWFSRNLDASIEAYEKAFEILGSVSNHRLDVNSYIKCLDLKAHQLIESGEYGDAIGICETIMDYRNRIEMIS